MDKRWLKQYDEDVPHSLEYPEMTLPEVLDRTAATHPEYPALAMNEIELSYADLKQRTDAFASALASLNVKKGDRVALLLPNSPTYVIAYYATVTLGGIVANLNVMSQGDELSRLLSHAGAKIIVTLDLFLKQVTEIADRVSLDGIIIHSVFGLERELQLSGREFFVNSVNDLIAANSGKTVKHRCTPNDVAVLQYTSGITGHPKAVMLTHRSIVSNLFQIDAWNPKPTEESRAAICIIPFFHVFGMTVCMHLSIFRGYQMILFPRFDWSSIIEILDAAAKYRPISFPAVPALWSALVNSSEADKYDISSIEIATGGGSPLAIDTQEQYKRLTGKYLSQAYGLSEASSTLLITPFKNGRISQSVGIPLPDTDVRIVDVENGNRKLATGEIGEIVCKGPQMMKGYWKDEEKTHRAIRDEWLYTGDLGYMDDEGFFYLVDRKDDLIITNGYNVYPSDIETVLTKHPRVKEVTVVGMPDPKRGESITAFILPTPGQAPERKDLSSYCRRQLPDYKIPRFFRFVDALPKNKIGKPIRRLLKQQYANS